MRAKFQPVLTVNLIVAKGCEICWEWECQVCFYYGILPEPPPQTRRVPSRLFSHTTHRIGTTYTYNLYWRCIVLDLCEWSRSPVASIRDAPIRCPSSPVPFPLVGTPWKARAKTFVLTPPPFTLRVRDLHMGGFELAHIISISGVCYNGNYRQNLDSPLWLLILVFFGPSLRQP